MIRILQIGRSSESGAFGGVEKFLLDHFRYIDKDKFSFDFLFCSKDPFESIKDDELMKNVKTTSLLALKDRKNKISAYFKLRKKIIEYLQQNKYDIVHINSGSIPTELACLSAAKKWV